MVSFYFSSGYYVHIQSTDRSICLFTMDFPWAVKDKEISIQRVEHKYGKNRAMESQSHAL